MARLPRRSRSPESPRSTYRNGHGGGGNSGGGGGSPSPSASSSRYDRSSHPATSSRRPDDRRIGSNRTERDDDHDDYRPKDRERDRDRDRDRGGDRDRDRDRERERKRDRERERDRARPRESDRRDRDRSRERPRDDDRRRRDERERGDRDDRRDDRRAERDRSVEWDNRKGRDDNRERHGDSDKRKLERPESRSTTAAPASSSRSIAPDRSAPVSKPTIPARSTLESSPAGSPGPSSEEEKQRLKRERLEAWKKQREKQKLEEGKAASATPEPADRKPVKPSPVPAKSPLPPAKSGTPSKLGSFTRMDFGNLGMSGLKRSFSALDDEEGPERKLEKLDLPDFNPEVQSGEAADEGVIGDDLAAEEHHEDVKPDVDANGDIVIDVPSASTPADVKPPQAAETKMQVDEEEEEDPLDAFMKEIKQDVNSANRNDAKRLGLMQVDEDEGKVVKNKAEEKLLESEALLAAAAAKSRKKDLPPPDHSKIHYEPFQKKFYRAPLEVEDLDAEELELLRLEMDGIKVRGVDVPKPVRNWGAFGLPMGCLDLIQRKGWTQATPIQAQSIPAIMSGRDVIGIAKTGSGKTISYLLPLFRHVKDQKPVTGAEGAIAMVMAPTRELALQIQSEIKPFSKALNFRVACCVGGGSISEDIAEMKKGAEVVICTPGRMIDLLTANNGRVTNCRRITYIVLDEADRMFDMGFEPQVMKIISQVRPDAQKVLFSATFPKTMESLARRILVKPLEITVGGRSVVAPEIDQRVEVRENDTKFTRLLEILGEQMQAHAEEEDDYRSLIFVDRQEGADDLFRELLQRGYICASLHGGKEQVDREEAIRNFKTGDVPMIVATSVAARGLDVKELKLVVNYDCPNHMEDYVHRAGRTGRAGQKGTCITFVTPEQDKYAVDIVRALEASNAFVPKELKNMSDGFLAKIKSGSAKASSGGFRGKGLERLDKKRDDKDRNEKSTYGDTSEALSLASREGAVIPYKAKTNEWKPAEAPKINEIDYTFTEIKVEIVHGPAPDKATNPGLYGTPGRNVMATLPQATIDALAKARKEGRHVDAGNLAKVVARLTQSIELTKAEKFGSPAPEPATTKKTKDPDATDWHAVFPINDYPQKARWKATNKEQMMLLSEVSGASITMRGNYYPPGEEPRMNGEPKLHLLIESNDEMKVRAAVEEIRRNLVEASVLALNNQDRSIGAATGGRYTV